MYNSVEPARREKGKRYNAAEVCMYTCRAPICIYIYVYNICPPMETLLNAQRSTKTRIHRRKHERETDAHRTYPNPNPRRVGNFAMQKPPTALAMQALAPPKGAIYPTSRAPERCAQGRGRDVRMFTSPSFQSIRASRRSGAEASSASASLHHSTWPNPPVSYPVRDPPYTPTLGRDAQPRTIRMCLTFLHILHPPSALPPGPSH